jgi:uncharacterized protein
VGSGAGFISGLTGVGGGVFLTPLPIAFGWASPKRAAQLPPLFILCNSVLVLGGVLLAGQKLAPGTLLYSLGALGGAVIGTAIGLRWMTQRGTPRSTPGRRTSMLALPAQGERARSSAHRLKRS